MYFPTYLLNPLPTDYFSSVFDQSTRNAILLDFFIEHRRKRPTWWEDIRDYSTSIKQKGTHPYTRSPCGWKSAETLFPWTRCPLEGGGRGAETGAPFDRLFDVFFLSMLYLKSLKLSPFSLICWFGVVENYNNKSKAICDPTCGQRVNTGKYTYGQTSSSCFTSVTLWSLVSLSDRTTKRCQKLITVALKVRVGIRQCRPKCVFMDKQGDWDKKIVQVGMILSLILQRPLIHCFCQ